MLRHALILESMGWGREVTPCQLSSPSVCSYLGALWICEVNWIVTLGYGCWNSSDNEEDLEPLRAESDSFFLSHTLLAENAVILLQVAQGVHVDCGIKWKSLSILRRGIPQTLKETVGSFLVSFLPSFRVFHHWVLWICTWFWCAFGIVEWSSSFCTIHPFWSGIRCIFEWGEDARLKKPLVLNEIVKR